MADEDHPHRTSGCSSGGRCGTCREPPTMVLIEALMLADASQLRLDLSSLKAAALRVRHTSSSWLALAFRASDARGGASTDRRGGRSRRDTLDHCRSTAA